MGLGIGKKLKKFISNPLDPEQAIFGKKWSKYIHVALGQFGLLAYEALLPKVPKPPNSIEARGKAYNPDLRQNQAALGEPKARAYGLNIIYPEYCSAPYREFRANNMVLAVYMMCSVGYGEVKQVNIGGTAANNYPGVQFEVLPPGVDMSLVRGNVSTCGEVDQLEMYGQTDSTDPDDVVTVAAYSDDGDGTIVFTTNTVTVPIEGTFDDFLPGDRIGIYDASDNDGSWTILSIGNDGKTLTVDIVADEPFVPDFQESAGFILHRRYVGNFWACRPGERVQTGAIDLDFRALASSGGDPSQTVGFELQHREGDDAGNILSDWTTTKTFTLTGRTARPNRFTVEWDVGSSMRPQFRLLRTTEEITGSGNFSACEWVGLKGYVIPLSVDAPFSDAECTRIAMLVAGSGMLSAQSSQSVNLLYQTWLPTYVDGDWTDPVATRSPAWACIDWLTNESDGLITYDQIDIPAFVALDEQCTVNGDTFDFVFDRTVGWWEGAQTILRVCRAAPLWDDAIGKFTVYRDEVKAPVGIFTDVNAIFGDDSINIPNINTNTGVQISYIDPLTGVERDGPIVGSGTDPRKARFPGATTWANAFREAQYEYRDILYRNHSCSMQCEMDALLLRYGDRVLVASSPKRWGQSGTVQAVSGLTLTVEPAPFWKPATDHFVYMQGPDGVPTAALPVTRGASDAELVLDGAPGVALRTGTGYRTIFGFGYAGNEPRVMIVQGRPSESQFGCQVALENDDPYVHADPGPPPTDPYSLTGTIPDLSITGLAGEQDIQGVILDETGDPVEDEDGNPLEDESSPFGVFIVATWDSNPDAAYYQVKWRFVGDLAWTLAYVGIAVTARFGIPSNGTVEVQVQAFGSSYIGAPATINVVVDAY